jgi:hypothetical protein
MKTNEKQIVVMAIVIIASFLCGSLATATVTNKYAYPVSSAQAQASFWSRLFGRAQADEITEIADIIRLVLDQIEKIHDLETRITVLEKCGPECEHKFPPPDYDSGWVDVGFNYWCPFEHNLNTMDYLVYIMKNDDDSRNEFHNYATGGEAFVRNNELLDMGTTWKASKNTIKVYRSIDDSRAALNSDYVRVLLWKIPQ